MAPARIQLRMHALPELPAPLLPLIETLCAGGVRPVVVGGFVRDALLGIHGKDIDIECYGVDSLASLLRLVRPFGPTDPVGKSFGVLKLRLSDLDVDLSLPRTETKTGGGHTGFDVRTFSRFDFDTAARRRDFTVNAIGYDPVDARYLDPFEGREDLRQRRLRCVDPATFVEDPLRVWRAVQFAARFELTPDETLTALIREMVSGGVLDELPKERVFDEFKKLLLKSERPSLGLRMMERLHATPFFPALNALKQVPMDPGNHPEGDVWNHTLLVLDAMAALASRSAEERLALMLAALCHDMGRALCTRLERGRIAAPGHARIGEKTVRAFLGQLTEEKRLIERVVTYVRFHGEPKRLYAAQASDADVLRLAQHVGIQQIALLAAADRRGRLRPESVPDAAAWLTAKAEALGVLTAPRAPLLRGEDLIRCGLEPSVRFKAILEAAYDAQLEGAFDDAAGAQAWLGRYLRDLG